MTSQKPRTKFVPQCKITAKKLDADVNYCGGTPVTRTTPLPPSPWNRQMDLSQVFD